MPGNWVATTFQVFQSSIRYTTADVSRTGPNVIRVCCTPAGPFAGAGTIDYDDAMETLVAEDAPLLPAASFTGLPCPPV